MHMLLPLPLHAIRGVVGGDCQKISALQTSRFQSTMAAKVYKLGLWSMWLSGILLITLSLYATQLLPSISDENVFRKSLVNERSNPSITIFAAPSPFVGLTGDKQTLAVRSWLGLSPDIHVVLFGMDPSFQSFAAKFGSRVSVESDIDFTFLGVPFFHSMFARAQASSSDISVLIDPETILLTDFISTLNYANELDHEWFLIASSRRVSNFPFHLDGKGKNWLGEGEKVITLKKLQEVLSQNWNWNYSEERMLMAWNKVDLPLHIGILPPFLYGKGIHNYWVINEAYHSKFRFVLDASWAISSFYLVGTQHNVSVREQENERRSWEYNENLRLGAVYGLLHFREAYWSDLIKLLKCDGQYLIANVKEKSVYFPESHSLRSLLKYKILPSRRQKRVMSCLVDVDSLHRIVDRSLRSNLTVSVETHLPLALESILSKVADNRTVVLAVAGYSYKDMLMNWVCRLRRLQITNFLVCALDDDIYQFSVLQGLPVFKDTLAPRNISFDDCHFGTKCFQKVTKRKSSLVLHILKLGYNVLLSDVDVYWFQNPLPLLQSFGPAVLVVQSDEYNVTGPINLPRRLNSGFYYARSDNATISAMEKVVKHALTSDLSEQPSFYDTLCGEGGTNRVGDNECWELDSNLTVHFLDRDLFPNGAYQGLWEKSNVRTACVSKGCYVLHNNWISGRLKKLERQVSSGLWEYDISSRMCGQRWHKTK